MQFDDSKLAFLADVLRRRSDVTGTTVGGYLARLQSAATLAEIGALAVELTVPETYFFRHFDQYRALSDVALPQLVADRAAERQLRVLSLGCATGEEPYTLAILMRGLIDSGWNVSILGVDINAVVLEKARRGRFSAWALRETAEAERQRWFRPDGRDFVLTDAARAPVRFEQRNLMDDDPQLWQRDSYDVVFCRNVIMYFSPDQAQGVVDRISRVLRKGGYLFLGHAETLRGLSTDFHLRHTHDTFYYQKKERTDEPALFDRPAVVRHADTSLLTAAADAESWVDVIHRASERVTALTTSPPRQGGSGSHNSPPGIPGWDRGVVLELLRAERFGEALAVVNGLPPAAAADPDVRLLRAVLLTHGGSLDEAEAACQSVLDVDELSAGAHYLLALCREGARDHAGAIHHDQVAAYLDPGFAMPRLHLGLLARRSGNTDTARKELGQALVLLQREDASRVLLFGGGFSRDALLTLCRAELMRSGAQP